MRRVILGSAATLGLLAGFGPGGEARAQATFNEPEATASTRYQVIPAIDPRGGRLPEPGRFVAARPAGEERLSPQAPAPGAYGGGFIELLVTGRDPTPARQPLRAAPAVPQGAAPAAAPAPRFRAQGGFHASEDDVHAWANRARRMAALPHAAPEDASETGIGRVANPRFRRQVVEYDGPHGPGTIVIDTPSKFLYLVQPGGKAVRYGIGVGRPGFEWAGMKTVTRKAEWPDWTPPPQMLKRRPDLPRFMAGGPGNPMGARALYLGSSLYRIHGTNEPHTIGQAVSSGCIRMMNEDVIDLYSRVKVGTRVLVI
jgi:lipoprotein-anchoring transpeptidase ErfK/SrfK